MVVLLFDEMILLAIVLAGDGAGHVIASITDRLEFRNFTKHSTDLGLGIIGEVGITHGVEILGNLQFHIIGYALVLLNTGEKFIEVTCPIVFLVSGTGRESKQLTHHAKHTLHTIRERLDLLLSLENRELWGLHETGCNEMQAEILFFINFLRLDNPAYKFLNLRNKPNKNKSVCHIESRMEGSKHETQLSRISQEETALNGIFIHRHIIAYPSADHIDERTEDKQNPDDTEDIEEHMSQCCATSLRIGRHCCQV